MKRFLFLLVLLAAGVIVAALEVPSPAASVNGTDISRQTVNNELTAVTASPNYECYVAASLAVASQGQARVQIGGVGANGSFNGTYDVNFADYTVEQLIDEQLIHQLFEARGLSLSPADMAVGRTVLSQRINTVLTDYAQAQGIPVPPCGGSAQAVLSSVPAWFQSQEITSQAEQAVLEAHAVGSSLSDAAAARYFAAHPAEFDTVCVSDIAVNTQAQAAFIRDAIINGASFADQAKAASIDSSTKDQGGAAGCAPAVRFQLSQLADLGVGQVTQPISYNGAYLLLTVTSRTPSTFAATKGLVRATILAAGAAKVQAQLTALLRHSTVTADPRYGRVVNRAGSLLIPPPSPPNTSLIAPLANIPGAIPAGGSA